jgi:hypothetical protein
MTHEEILTRFRAGLQTGRFTLRDVEEATGIPYTTLCEMRRPDWQEKTFERLDKLKRVVRPKRRARRTEAA